MRVIRALRRRLAAEAGYSMVAVMLLLLVGSLFAIAAWSSAKGDIPQSQDDYNRKQAAEAAEAGLNWYLFHLNQDNQYWTYCTQPPGAPPVGSPNQLPLMQPWDGTSARPFRAVPGSNTGQYVVELVPQNGKTQCVPGDGSTMINSADGTLQIKATGQSQKISRTYVGTFRRKGFLDFLYFTNFETLDPVAVSKSNPNYIGLSGQCNVYRWTPRPSGCVEIQFVNSDKVNGPFHSNDNVLVCGSPTFGRANSGDKVETGGPAPPASAPGFVPNSGCTATPNILGTPVPNAPNLPMPSTNTSVASVADPQYTFSGRKYVTLDGASNTITVADDYKGTNSRTLDWPANGVIAVKTLSPLPPKTDCNYDIVQNYNNPSACGEVYVHGTYSRGLTITTDNDIIVNGPLIRQGNGMLGLIATNFVRVWHPVDRTKCSVNSNPVPSMGPSAFSSGLEIDAAIMSLTHSFIVDNYDCGPPEGNLTVKGAIAQFYRGPVGTGSGSSIATGYVKDYNYDDRFKNQNPPYFLTPVDSEWQLVRFTEQVPPG